MPVRGKTFFMSLLMACCAQQRVLGLERIDCCENIENTGVFSVEQLFTRNEDLRRAVMALSWILQSRYYDKVFRLANEQRVIRTTMDRSGRIVVIPLPS